MAKGGKSGGYGGGGGPEGQSKKMCQVFLRNLPLAMLEPVSCWLVGWLAALAGVGVLFWVSRRGPGVAGAPPGILSVSYTHLTLPTILLV